MRRIFKLLKKKIIRNIVLLEKVNHKTISEKMGVGENWNPI